MEGKSTQNSTLGSKIFEIPVDLYKKDFDLLSSKEKEEEILYLFANSNQLRSEEEFNEIKGILHIACMMG